MKNFQAFPVLGTAFAGFFIGGDGFIMPAVNLRRRVSPVAPYYRNYQEVNGFYVHSSPPKGHYRLMVDFDDLSDIYIHTFPPRVVQMNPSMIRQWLRGGEIDQLEQVVLEGKGHKLIGEYSPDPKVRNFIKSIPNYLAKISELHEAVNKGDLDKLKSVMPTDDSIMKNIALCKDLTGAGLLHKAVYKDRMDIVRWLLEKYPETIKHKDRDGKTALHYCGVSSDRENMWKTLIEAGADPNLFDSRGRTPAFYMERPGAIELPEPKIPSGNFKRFTSGKDGLVVKPSNIRIWIHDRDLGRLQQVLWEGHGNKLRTETSNNPRVKKFLDSIPYAMNAIKDVHAAVVNNDYEEFAKKTADPIPVHVLGSKDVNGLNPLHKAAGLGRQNMVEDILDKNPKLAFSMDHEGRTPLHYAAWLKNNDYICTLLIENGADEMAFDNNGKLPSYYKANPKEPFGKLLSVIPDAPRTSVTYPPNWDWALLQASSARSTQNIPQLINHGIQSEKKSVSDYDVNRLRPPEGVKPDFLIERIIQPVEEKIIKVEQKIFGEDIIKPEKIEEKHSEKKNEVKEEPTENKLDLKEPIEKEDIEIQEEEVKETELREVKEIVKEEPEEDNKETETEKEIEKMEEEVENVEENKIEEENMQDEEINPVEVETPPVEVNNLEDEKEQEEKKEGEMMMMNKLDEESEHEKTEREIAEERQRMLDEGLIKVADEEEDEEDEEIEEIIRNGDMQGLATLVLEGEGERLLGKKSDNSEIQGFLDNVPSYIAKIKAVHKAARAGELRDLQAALDRRRFAIAKDGSNSMGVTPLHAAVLFGRTPIVKYLGGRFPETLNAKDKKGRTPLHYAATLADNGHYFNILLNLGADRKIKDEAGNNPGYYLENPGRMTQEMLLQEFNAPAQIAKEILSDKEFPLFGTDEGKYLANALGEPLIRGLTEIANKRPSDPITYLANFLLNFINKNKGLSSPVTDPSLHTRESEQRNNEGGFVAREKKEEEEEEEIGDENDGQSAFAEANRDEYGQTVLHFAAARAHGRSGMFQLIQESGINLGYRDELYRTARDVALQANIPENINEIDKFVLGLAARGETEKLTELLLEGYDHILDLEDDEDSSIVEVVNKKEQIATLDFLRSIPGFEEKRERVHRAIRAGDFKTLETIVAESDFGRKLLIGKSTTSRCSLHIAVLCQQETVTEYIAQKYPETLRIGDNLERTALHYAMGVDKVESLSRILIQCGAKRVAKDLKGRQPTYYFMNKSDILRLQEEEELLRM